MESNSPVVYVISDALGETAEFVVRAAASQFNSGHVEVRRIPYVDDSEHLKEVVRQAAREKAVIAYTLVLDELRQELEKLAAQDEIPLVDILGPMIQAIGRRTNIPPKMEPGLLRKMDQDYFKRIEAVEFAVKYDDGKDSRGLLTADLVLLGVSRTSKTPVSMYLAHRGLKVANVPLVPEVRPPEELFKLPRDKVVGLTVNPEVLVEIRTERLKALGLSADASYANPKRILEEIAYAENLMKRLGCPVVDVTNRAVEETAGRILEIYMRGERLEQ